MVSVFKRLRGGLAKTRDGLSGTLDRLTGQQRLSDDLADALEEALLGADVGIATSEKLIAAVRVAAPRDREAADDWAAVAIRNELVSLLHGKSEPPPALEDSTHKPHVVLIVGVNGTGKTTSVGKLAWHLNGLGKKVLLVAADTFRAAASEQLSRWGVRVGVDVITSASGADPASVAFDGVKAGVARGADYVLVDTAGRLHSKVDLMEELDKIHRVIGKTEDGAPHDVWLVLDGTNGQNAIEQARRFQTGFPLTGLILTKIDGTARGGAVVAIADQLDVPVRYVGVGEQLHDLVPFDAIEFVDALLGPDGEPEEADA